MDRDDSPELRLVDDNGEEAEGKNSSPADSFSQALIDEEARGRSAWRGRSPRSTTCRSSTSALTGVDPEAAKAIALPVLKRVVAIPFASDEGKLKVAITDPQDVWGLDELQLATRQTVEIHVVAENDVLTELRASRARPRR